MDIGAKLRNAREARGLSVASLSAITRLAPRWLETIERNDHPSVFPPGPYARGYVRSYAREVGLDPDETTREYFEQFAPPRDAAAVELTVPNVIAPVEAGPRYTLVAPAAVALCVIFGMGIWTGWRGRTPSRAETGAVGTSGPAAAALPATGTSAPSPTLPAAEAPLTVTLIADKPAWITATADGKRVLYRLLAPSARETVRGNRQLTIRVGNAGAVRWTVGGRDIGPMGRSGAVRTITVTPENAATVR